MDTYTYMQLRGKKKLPQLPTVHFPTVVVPADVQSVFKFSIALFVMIDAATYSRTKNGSDFHVNFVDWIPSIFSALGMLIFSSIDKSRLSADNFSYSGDGVAWKARVVLFMGFAAMAGGLAGGVTGLDDM